MHLYRSSAERSVQQGNDPGKNAPDYIADRFFGRRYYTTRGSHRGILLAILFSFVASVVICIVSVPAYNRGLGDTPEDSAKAIVDDNLKILVQNGISGFFNRYDSLNGLNRGALGGVSSVSPDFETDLVVSFVPYGSETIYLPGFKGVTYSGMNWYNRINTAEFPELEITGTQYIDSQTIDSIDYSILGNVFKMKDAVTGVMQISYLDRSFGLEVSPYITYPGSRYIAEDPLYVPEDPEKNRVFGTSQMEYYPIKFAEYLDADDYADNGVTGLSGYEIKMSSFRSEDDLPDSTRATYTDELTNGRMLNYSEERAEYDRLEYKDYVYDVCLKVPYALDRYLDRFVKEHSYFGLRNILNQLKSLTYDLNSMREYGVPVEIKTFDFDGTMVPYYDSVSVIEKGYELKDAINEYRLQVCQAIENMFYEEYPYTLSPGKTPADEDFVQYFLENQKRGYCAHFASAAVMILRHLGIPARYVEGYCIPHSLMKEYSVKLEDKQEGWLSLEDNIYNPENAVYQVEVSDYYAHAWVEVYLEGKGFVPYEFTPPSFEAIPEGGGAMSDIGKFFSRLMNVDLGIGNPQEESISVVGEAEHVVEEVSGIDLDVVFRPLAIVIAVSVIFWMLFLLIRKIIREIRFAGYLKEENYRPLVYGRYQEFVNRLKRKKIVKEKNPLPMELSHILAEYSEVREDEYEAVFKYVEKVLYSSETTDKNEYLSFYGFIRNFRYRKKNT